MSFKIITEPPMIAVLAEQTLLEHGVLEMARWVQEVRPECVPKTGFQTVYDLLPHNGRDNVPGVEHPKLPGETRHVSDNEILCELAGRKCYDSFAEKGAKRTNGQYLSSMWQGRIPHRSTGYHAKMTFFIADVSRRVSHELIRNYVGADRDEEGAPSQESTRFTHHPGRYIAPIRDKDDPVALASFENVAYVNYNTYLNYIAISELQHKKEHGESPKGMDRKRIYEAASNYLLHSCSTSFIWTTNPMALTKFFHERDHDAADAEIQRFAKKWKRLCLTMWPNLFPDFTDEAAKIWAGER